MQHTKFDVKNQNFEGSETTPCVVAGSCFFCPKKQPPILFKRRAMMPTVLDYKNSAVFKIGAFAYRNILVHNK